MAVLKIKVPIVDVKLLATNYGAVLRQIRDKPEYKGMLQLYHGRKSHVVYIEGPAGANTMMRAAANEVHAAVGEPFRLSPEDESVLRLWNTPLSQLLGSLGEHESEQFVCARPRLGWRESWPVFGVRAPTHAQRGELMKRYADLINTTCSLTLKVLDQGAWEVQSHLHLLPTIGADQDGVDFQFETSDVAGFSHRFLNGEQIVSYPLLKDCIDASVKFMQYENVVITGHTITDCVVCVNFRINANADRKRILDIRDEVCESLRTYESFSFASDLTGKHTCSANGALHSDLSMAEEAFIMLAELHRLYVSSLRSADDGLISFALVSGQGASIDAFCEEIQLIQRTQHCVSVPPSTPDL